MKLTDKQERFCQEYLCDLNATQAARRAGYAPKRASEQGYQLLQKTPVQERIRVLKAERSNRTAIDADYMLRRLVAELEADLADLYSEQGILKPVHEWPRIWRQGLVAGFEVKEDFTHEGDQKLPVGATTKIRFSDRLARIKLLGDHVDVQAFRQRVEFKHTESLEDRLEKAMAKRAEYAKTLGGKIIH